ELVCTAIAYSKDQGYQQMFLNAQIQAESFYQRLGFESVGDRFLDAGIPHIKMVKPLVFERKN
ncbi:MAG: GNAT family N-acetyltransferase, partial [Cyanobacteria bacterium P01_F01_bin.42]